MIRLKENVSSTSSNQDDPQSNATFPSTHPSFQKIEQQYEQMNDMFAQQQEFLIMCMGQMLQVQHTPSNTDNLPTTTSNKKKTPNDSKMKAFQPTQTSHAAPLPATNNVPFPSSEKDSAMKAFAHKTQQAIRLFSTTSTKSLASHRRSPPFQQTANTPINPNHFRRPQDPPNNASKSHLETKRTQSVAHTTDSSQSSDTKSPQSKRHDVKNTPPPTRRSISKQNKPSNITTPPKPLLSPTLRPSSPLDSPAFDEALANLPSPLLTHQQQQEYINPEPPSSEPDGTELKPTRLSLEKAHLK